MKNIMAMFESAAQWMIMTTAGRSVLLLFFVGFCAYLVIYRLTQHIHGLEILLDRRLQGVRERMEESLRSRLESLHGSLQALEARQREHLIELNAAQDGQLGELQSKIEELKLEIEDLKSVVNFELESRDD